MNSTNAHLILGILTLLVGVVLQYVFKRRDASTAMCFMAGLVLFGTGCLIFAEGKLVLSAVGICLCLISLIVALRYNRLSRRKNI